MGVRKRRLEEESEPLWMLPGYLSLLRYPPCESTSEDGFLAPSAEERSSWHGSSQFEFPPQDSSCVRRFVDLRGKASHWPRDHITTFSPSPLQQLPFEQVNTQDVFRKGE